MKVIDFTPICENQDLDEVIESIKTKRAIVLIREGQGKWDYHFLNGVTYEQGIFGLEIVKHGILKDFTD